MSSGKEKPLSRVKKGIILLLVFTVLLAAVSCGSPGSGGQKAQKEQTETETDTGTRMFTDSVGREVELPETIESVAPSGMVAQVMLYTLCPDMLCGLSQRFTDYAFDFVDEKYLSLPLFGQLYGSGATLNLEALMEAQPDVIIDIGEKKENMAEDLDGLQEQIGIPVIFVEATLPTMAEAYRTLGELGCEPERAQTLAQYCEDTLAYADEKAAQIPEEERKTVYFAMGDDGLTTTTEESIHADVVERIGAVNAAQKDALPARVGTVSFEQILVWQPDFILAETPWLYEGITQDSLWQDVTAVQEGRIFVIPYKPYSYMNSPPSVNRMIGVWWLGELLYPEVYNVDIEEKIAEFYELFYHVVPDEAQIQDILSQS